MEQFSFKGQTSLQQVFIIAIVLVAGIIVISTAVDYTQPSGEAFAPTSKQITRQPIYNLEITLSTLKDSYTVGEDVDLTGDSENNAMRQNSQIYENQNLLARNIQRPIQKLSTQQITATREDFQLSEVKLFDEASIRKRINDISFLGTRTTKMGRIETIHYDDFENERSENQYFLKDDSTGQKYRVYFASEPSLISGTRVELGGLEYEEEIVASDFEILEQQPLRTADTIGEQRTAVILVNFQDNPPPEPMTNDEVRYRLFEDLNPVSTNNFVREVSYNKTFLSGEVFGWYTLPYSDRCYNVVNRAIQAADADIYFPNYTRLIVLYAPANCNGGTSGSIGLVPTNTLDGQVMMSYSKILIPDNPNIEGIMEHVLNHELGHNFGLLHATYWDCGDTTVGEYPGKCSSIDYGNYFDTMGHNYGHYNAFYKEYLGWFDESNILETSEWGTYFIEPIEAATPGIKTLKIPLENGLNYYVEYRRPIGFDSSLLEYLREYNNSETLLDGAMINLGFWSSRLLDNTPEGMPGESYHGDLINSVLRPGYTFYDEQNQIILTPIEITEDYLVVQLGNANCGNGTIDNFEQCDTDNFNGETCNSLGYESGGELDCSSQCRFDTSLCMSPICGRGHIYNGGNSCTAMFISPDEQGIVGNVNSNWDSTRRIENFIYTIHDYYFDFLMVSNPSGFSSIRRVSLPFDTTSLPESSLIQSGELKLWYEPLGFPQNTHPSSNDFITVVPTTLANSPFVNYPALKG